MIYVESITDKRWGGKTGPATTSSTNLAPEAHSPNESKGQGPAVLERVHSFSVNKQQVSIVQVNTTSNNSTLTLNSSDHPDIQYADSEEVAQANTTAAAHGKFRIVNNLITEMFENFCRM